MGTEIVFFGLLISLLFISISGYYPGGIIVPSYLVIFLSQPQRIIGTVVAAIVTVLCFRLTSRFLILFGKRRFVFMILVGSILSFLWLQFFPYVFPLSPEYRVIGWVIPGLIANNYERQGIIVTTSALITVLVFLYFVNKIIYLVV